MITTFVVQQAVSCLLEAIRIQKEIGNQPELARSYVGYARLLGHWGRTETAGEYLDQAAAMFQEMGMSSELEQAT